METFELRYFMAVAKTENIHKASEILNITPSAISKALSRLEEELEIKLFEKVGRNIKITDKGIKLVKDASELLAMEKRMVESYNSDNQEITLRIVGPELPLTQYVPQILAKVRKTFSGAQFILEPVSNDEALTMVENFSADLAIVASNTKKEGKMFHKLGDVKFNTIVSQKHPLARKRGPIPVEEILDHTFVYPEGRLIGAKSSESSPDGWRDDKFKRQKTVSTSSLKCLEALMAEGLAIAYLPDVYGKSLGFKALNISGCPYQCTQQIYLARGKYSLDSVWELIS